MIRSSISHFQLLKMIINEQHHLDKARENVYILQKGLPFFVSSSKQGFSSPLALVLVIYQPRKRNSMKHIMREL